MTRRFLDDVRSDLTALLVPDGETTADELRPLMIDMIDSLNTDQGALTAQAVSIPLVTTQNYVAITGYTGTVGGDGSFLILDQLAGTITSSNLAGFSYTYDAQVSFVADNNADYEFVFLQDGVQLGFVGTITGSGNNDLQTVSLTGTQTSAPANAVLQLALRSVSGGDDIELTSFSLRADIIPTNNP